MKDSIQEGDIVDVFFNRSNTILAAEILHTPAATGDCFTLKDQNGRIYNVQQYDYMVKIEIEDKDEVPF